MVPTTQAGPHPPESSRLLAAAAHYAQDRCYRLIHHDTDEFGDCLYELLSQEQRPSLHRLGIEYFGWVGALNSARVGMRDAEPLAYEFLGRFRITQRRMHIDDQTLCQSVPGDCTTRLARMRLMEKTPPMQAAVVPSKRGTRHRED